MKLVRVRTASGGYDGVIDDRGRVRRIGPDGSRLPLDDLLVGAAAALIGDGPTQPMADLELDAPLRPGKIICVGLNYADHAAEGGQAAPSEPILFLKLPETVVGPTDPVILPPGSTHTDWEVELGIVIGREAAYLTTTAEATAAIAGFVLVNDVSERHHQLECGGQWDKGKNSPTFCPMGPWMLTSDEVADPQRIPLGLEVNGVSFQHSSTTEMIFGVAELVLYVSQFFSLRPGDVISTGTPAGVGAGQRPPRYLQAGDEMRVWAGGLGEQRSPVIATNR